MCSASFASCLAASLVFAGAAGAWQWQRLPDSVYGERYDDLCFVSPEEGWAVNGHGEIWHTEDGGESWDLQYENDGAYFRSIDFANEKVGWAGTVTSGAGPLYATKDGGRNWQQVTNLPLPTPVAICGIDAVDENVMYATGVWSGPAHVVRTTDGGTTWNVARFPDVIAVGLIDLRFTSPTEGIVVGGVGSNLFEGYPVIIRTDDGVTWHQQYVADIPKAWCWKIHFPTPEVGYISVERVNSPHYFLKTTDGGETWSEEPFDGGARSQGIGFATENLGWIGGPASVNPTYVTTDGGESWSVDGFGLELNRFQFFGSGVGYAAGDYIYKYTRDVVDVPAVATDAPAPPHRSRPNPFRPMTTIGYTLPRGAHVTLFVADPGGRLVKTLTDAYVAAGDHEIEWDGTNDAGEEVASGLYLYVIRSDALDAIGKLVKVE